MTERAQPDIGEAADTPADLAADPENADSPDVVTQGWQLTNHVCRVCFGRILRKRDKGLLKFMCACCEATKHGNVHSLCCCGWKFNDVGAGPAKRKGENMGIRCVANPNKSPLSPSVIVGREV